MLIKKINIAKYALKMKRQGYQLLKNPKGTSPNIIRILKYNKTYDSSTSDILEHYELITKDFSQPQNTIRDSLFINNVTTLVDTTKKLIKRTKVKEFYRYSGETENNIINYKIKGRYPDRNRVSIVDDLNKKIYNKEVFDVSLDFRPQYPQPLRLWLKGKMKNTKECLNEIEAKKIKEESVNNNFWKNLFINLFKN